MTSSAELVRIALLALLTGVAVPLLVQLFLTLRSVRVATDALGQRLEKILNDVNAIADEVKARAAAPNPLAVSLTAAVPAVLAAVHAFRTSMHTDGTAETHQSNDRETKERSHEQRSA